MNQGADFHDRMKAEEMPSGQGFPYVIKMPWNRSRMPQDKPERGLAAHVGRRSVWSEGRVIL